MQDLQRYWDFTLAIFFGFGLTFEVPVVEMLLVKLGMVTTSSCAKRAAMWPSARSWSPPS